MDKLDLKLDSTRHASLAKEARRGDEANPAARAGLCGSLLSRSFPSAGRGGGTELLLPAWAREDPGDPRGWLDPAKRKEDPCFQGLFQAQVASWSHWAETPWDEKARKEMAGGCREWAEKCGEASRMLHAR